MAETGLYLVPTPIGNLEDITLRALRILKEVDLVLAEDTRTSSKLLKHYDIQQKLKSFHIHNEHKAVNDAVSSIKDGQVLALVSDAGTPGISDPGFLLVRACLANQINVECLPGPTAFVPALVKSGFPTDRFVYEGFLPHKKGRQTRINAWLNEERTIVVYESPHRLIKLLTQCQEILGEDRKISVSRELTKIYEETVTGSISEVLVYFDNNPIKGEIVVTIAGVGA
ncbi:MAG: 16S rRNA (cytidine(1402)-2'-O)-methyltransferase [Bacteroidota bacterium]